MTNRLLFKIVLSSLILNTICMISLSAQEAEKRSSLQILELDKILQNKADHIEVGSRSMPQCERIAIQEKREVVQQECKGQIENQISEENSGVVEKDSSNAYYSGDYCNHPGTFHTPYAMSVMGDYITLEDGSVWNVYSGHAYAVLNWFSTDPVVIIQNTDLFSFYPYKLVNQNTGIMVDATLSAGPIYGNPYTLLITATDSYSGRISLSDGTIWQIPPSDDAYLNCASSKCRWMVGDAVILGSNNGAYVLSYPSILINVNTDSYAYGLRIF